MKAMHAGMAKGGNGKMYGGHSKGKMGRGKAGSMIKSPASNAMSKR